MLQQVERQDLRRRLQHDLGDAGVAQPIRFRGSPDGNEVLRQLHPAGLSRWRVAATLAKIVRKLQSRAARNVSDATRNAITKPAADLGTSVKGLAARLACPTDAT